MALIAFSEIYKTHNEHICDLTITSLIIVDMNVVKY